MILFLSILYSSINMLYNINDYINLFTPYRGLLIYHGLGAGKTCASIAIAEGIKSEKEILILTPASLQDNYLNELKKCGDEYYKLNQYWEYLHTEKLNEFEKNITFFFITLKP